MIAFVDREWTGEIANRLRGVGRYNASRLLVLAYEPRRERLDARVTIVSEGEPAAGEFALLRETVVVELGDRHLDDLLTIADPLVVTDLPTLLWSPHGHYEIVESLLSLAQAVLIDSVDEPDLAGGDRPRLQAERARLRRRPRVAALDPVARARRGELRSGRGAARSCARSSASRSATTRRRRSARCCSSAGSPRGWTGSPARWSPAARRSSARRTPAARTWRCGCRSAPELQVRGLEGLTLATASGRELSLDRGPGGLRARSRDRGGSERTWTIPGASRGEGGILGEGIRQALLRDPTYVPAARAAQAMLP